VTEVIGRQRLELAIESQTRSAAFAEAPRETTRSPHSAKKIRYTAEFFHFFFSGARPYVRAVAQLQEGLGAFNDEASATHLLWDIEAAAGPQAAKAAGIVLGWCERGTMIADDNLRKSWKSFRRTRPFWR
jgi:triphosphatase